MPPQSSSIGWVEWKLSVWPDVYEGSGPDEDRFLESEAERDSWASRQGNERAGFDDSASRAAAVCWALRGDCRWMERTAWFHWGLATHQEGCAGVAAKHCGVAEAARDGRARASRLRGTLMAGVLVATAVAGGAPGGMRAWRREVWVWVWVCAAEAPWPCYNHMGWITNAVGRRAKSRSREGGRAQ